MRKISLCIVLASGVSLAACGAIEEEEVRTAEQELRGGGSGIGVLDPLDPVGFESCGLYYPSCQALCDSSTVDPGTPGTCCMGDFRSSCYEAGIYAPGDKDQDGVPDPYDNCVYTPNASQSNQDQDTWGDACDNCPTITNQDQHDGPDYDGIGNVCDDDDDNDGVLDIHDNCPTRANSDQADLDQDGSGDACDDDIDNDGVLNGWDNCDYIPNPDQKDFDGDSRGNVCDDDDDNDGVLDIHDNCPTIPNPGQQPSTRVIGAGTACDHSQMALERVRVQGGGHPRAEYSAWDNHNISNTAQINTVIGRVSDPPRGRVRHLVFVSAGQQFSELSCELTGQRANYEANFPRTAGSSTVTTQAESLLGDMMADRTFEPAETFIGAAVDAKFSFLLDGITKQNVEDAYYDWLRGQYHDQNLQSIFLAGHSRGGCLVARLARRFQQDYPQVPIIVQLYDPVCSMGEFGVNVLGAHDNPLENDTLWRARPTNFENQLTPPAGFDRSNLRVMNIISADPVLDFWVAGLQGILLPWTLLWTGRDVTSFTHVGDPATLDEAGQTWYERHWSVRNHDWVGRESTSAIGPYTSAGIDHANQACAQLGCF